MGRGVGGQEGQGLEPQTGPIQNFRPPTIGKGLSNNSSCNSRFRLPAVLSSGPVQPSQFFRHFASPRKALHALPELGAARVTSCHVSDASGSFPRFSSLLCYAASKRQPASTPSAALARIGRQKEATVPLRLPTKKRSVNQRGRASTSGDQIPTDTPSWRTRQFKTPIPSRNIYFIILRIDLDLHPSHPTCHPICSSRGLATPAQAHHHCTPVVGAGCRVVLTRRFRPASSSPFPGLENTPSTAAGPSSHRVT